MAPQLPARTAQLAAESLAEWPAGGQHDQERAELAAARLRLAQTAPDPHADPLVEELIAEALAGGAAVGLEARVWAAVSLLKTPGRGEMALSLSDQVAADLDRHRGVGAPAASWRLLLAFHAGRAGYATIMQPLLRPLLNADDTDLQDAAQAVLHAAGGPQADTRLQVILLEAELEQQPSDDDRLRLHHALADAYGDLGDYRRALDHTQCELPLRNRLQGPEHPDTLATRYDLARWTGLAGDAAGARD